MSVPSTPSKHPRSSPAIDSQKSKLTRTDSPIESLSGNVSDDDLPVKRRVTVVKGKSTNGRPPKKTMNTDNLLKELLENIADPHNRKDYEHRQSVKGTIRKYS